MLTFEADFSQPKTRFAVLKGRSEFALRRRLGPTGAAVAASLEAVIDAIFRAMK